MSTIQQILDDVKLRYRHTFTNDQVLVWGNEEQRELFEILEIESEPYSFTTVADTYIYPIPSGVDIDRIRTITLQIDTSTPANYQEVEYRRNDDHIDGFTDTYWYTTLADNFFFNIPGGAVDGRTVYIYCDTEPTDMSSGNLSVEPSVPVRYQELLKLGMLKRIAAARKDAAMYNNYLSDYEAKIADLEWKMKSDTPEFIQPVSTLPKRSQNTTYVNWW